MFFLLGTELPHPPAAEASSRSTRSPRLARPSGAVDSRASRVGLRLVGTATAQVALELLGDGVAARLGQVGGVLGLLEALDVLGHLGVGRGQLVDAALPGVGVLVELTVL